MTIQSVPLKVPTLAQRGRQRRRGFVLIEVLIAGLIFAFGILGIVGLQANMTRAQTAGKFRGDAINLAQELIGTLWSDYTLLSSYDTATGNCGGNPRCNSWRSKVARELPSGTAVVTVSAGGNVDIRVNWTTTDGNLKYETQTAVVR